MKRLLVVIFIFSLGGLAFSGVLSYRELSASGPAACAPLGEPDSILGAPACVYGFFMYLAISVLTAVALLRARATPLAFVSRRTCGCDGSGGWRLR
ncbi:MAG: hypothetical protein AB7T06_14660 [Kofleriaceae bacterium]